MNFKHKGKSVFSCVCGKGVGVGGTPQLRKWATEAAMCAGAAVKSA